MKHNYNPNIKNLTLILLLLLSPFLTIAQTKPVIKDTITKTIHQQIINADDRAYAHRIVLVSFENSGCRWYTTDSAGCFDIILPNSIYEITLSISYKEIIPISRIDDNVSYNLKMNNTPYYIVYNYENWKQIRINECLFYSDYKTKTIFVPRPNIHEKEEIVKGKFHFRDVKQLNTRYSDIYLRY